MLTSGFALLMLIFGFILTPRFTLFILMYCFIWKIFTFIAILVFIIAVILDFIGIIHFFSHN